MKRTFFFIFSIILCCSALAQPLWGTLETYPKREARAVWVTTLGGLDWPKSKASTERGREQQKRELCTLLDQLKACGINQVILQTRVRGSVIYPSAIEPWDVALTGQYDRDPGYDPLAFAIEETHRRGMELHAWVVTIPAFKVDQAKKIGKKSLFSTHPKWLVKHGDMYYLDPAIQETSDYISRICKEIVTRYDVDGIHFDYIRYPENAGSFPDAAQYNKYGKGKTKANWRRDNITRIVTQAHREVKALKPWVRMSCSPVGKYRDTRRYSSRGWNCYDAVYQDPKAWLRDGVMDALYPMMYFTGDHFYPFVMDWQEGSYGRTVCPGLGIYFLSPQEKNWDFNVIGRELHYVRQQGTGGQAYFRAKFLIDNHKGIYNFLRNNYYPHPALTPVMTWQDNVPPTTPHSPTKEELPGFMMRITWQPSTDNMSAGGVRYNIYASKGEMDVTRAENLIATGLTECSYTFNQITAYLYDLHLAVTAMDRCGNESEPLFLP